MWSVSLQPSAVSIVACDDFMPQGSSIAQMEEKDTPSIISNNSGGDSGSSSHITDEQEEWFEEVYDLKDAEYARWVRQTRSELQSNALQDGSLSDFFLEVESPRAQGVVVEATPTSSKRMLPYILPPWLYSTPHLNTLLPKFLTNPHL